MWHLDGVSDEDLKVEQSGEGPSPSSLLCVCVCVAGYSVACLYLKDLCSMSLVALLFFFFFSSFQSIGIVRLCTRNECGFAICIVSGIETVCNGKSTEMSVWRFLLSCLS